MPFSSSFKKVLLKSKNKKEVTEDLEEPIKDDSSAAGTETLDEDDEVEEEPNVEYSSVLVENHLDDQPVETELVLTTTTTYNHEEDLVQELLLQQEEEDEEQEGFLAQCTTVRESPYVDDDEDDSSTDKLVDETEVILNTNDLSHCTSVLIEQQGNKPTETEMVLITARMKTIQEEQQDQEEQQEGEEGEEQEEDQEDNMPEVIPPSEEDLIVVLTDDNTMDYNNDKEEETSDDLLQEEEESKDAMERADDAVSVSLQSFQNIITANANDDNDNVMHQDLQEQEQEAKEEEEQESRDTPIVHTIDHDADNVSVSLQSFENNMAAAAKKKNKPMYIPGMSARRPSQERVFRPLFYSMKQRQQPQEEESKEEQPQQQDDYSTRPIMDAATQRALLQQEEHEMAYDQKPSMLSLATLQYDLWIKLIHHHGSTPNSTNATNQETRTRTDVNDDDDEDDDDATSIAGQTLGQTTIGTESSAGITSAATTTAHNHYAVNPFSILCSALDDGSQEMALRLAEAMDQYDPSNNQLGQFLANNYWLQEKAEKAGMSKNDFQQVMADLLFL
mmetsp:Transcript_41306/g.99513  ORF Transcript_41306/g.99513 Transcript_41306/m.99513 type:complete len:561 (+) Transcript_41306:378-2060(+)